MYIPGTIVERDGRFFVVLACENDEYILIGTDSIRWHHSEEEIGLPDEPLSEAKAEAVEALRLIAHDASTALGLILP